MKKQKDEKQEKPELVVTLDKKQVEKWWLFRMGNKQEYDKGNFLKSVIN